MTAGPCDRSAGAAGARASGEARRDQALRRAREHLGAGRLGQAETQCRKLLEARPDDADALHLLAMVASRRGRHDAAIAAAERLLALEPDRVEAHVILAEALRARGDIDRAIEHYARAVELRPDHAGLRNNLASTYRQAGRPEAAIAEYREALARDPKLAAAHLNLGALLRAEGQPEDAARHLEAAVTLAPDDARAWNGLGTLMRQLGRHDEAESRFRRALAIDPNLSEANYNLGVELGRQGKLEQARRHYEAALKGDPDFEAAHNNLANLLRRQGRLAEAVSHYERAIDLNPRHYRAHYNLGSALADAGDPERALKHLEAALAIEPDFAGAHTNLGNLYLARGDLERADHHLRRALSLDPQSFEANNSFGTALQAQGKIEQATAQFEKALALDPESAEAHFNLGLAWLLRGAFEKGWPEYEWRWGTKGFTGRRPDIDKPEWDGAPLEGRTILLYPEQGLGDCIQFVRYAPLVAARGGTVVVACQPSLKALFETVPGVARVTTTGDRWPRVDLQAPLMSLPRIFGTTLDSVPGEVPYLSVPEAAAGRFDETLARRPGKRRIGIAWAGNPNHRNDRQRSCPLRHFLTLAELPEVALFSLQKEAPEADPVDDSRVHVLEPIDDFAATAAALARLDLVVTVDTAVAHLAGALARPVWLVLPFAPDWRWLLERDDSPWYPTMRLFRQPRPGDWEDVFARVGAALAAAP